MSEATSGTVGLPGGSRADLERYVRLLEERFGPDLVSVVLFGSRARGTAGPDNDIDLLVVIHGLPGSRLERQRVLFGVARAVSEEFADALMPVPLTPEEAAVKVGPFVRRWAREEAAHVDAHPPLADEQPLAPVDGIAVRKEDAQGV